MKKETVVPINGAKLYQALKDAGIVVPPMALEITISIRQNEAPIIESKSFVCVREEVEEVDDQTCGVCGGIHETLTGCPTP